jgi:putative sporulation protein YyaC
MMTGNMSCHLKIPFTTPDALQQLSRKLEFALSTVSRDRRLVVVCVGTDRSTGDSLGPQVGSLLLREASPQFDLYGTLEEPVHAKNLDDTLLKIRRSSPNPFVIGVDACLGQMSSVGCIEIGEGPMHPGAGVNKVLTPVGDIHLTGVVNVGGFMEHFVLQNTRLHIVMQMADIMANTLLQSIHHVRGRVDPYEAEKYVSAALADEEPKHTPTKIARVIQWLTSFWTIVMP